MPKMPKPECHMMVIDFSGWTEQWQNDNPDHATWTCEKHGVQHYTGFTLIHQGNKAHYCPDCIFEFFSVLPRMTLNGDTDA